jgi:hypothetical protein
MTFRVMKSTDSFEWKALLANSVPPWGVDLLGRGTIAEVREPGELPVLIASSDAQLARVINQEWRHEDILSALRCPNDESELRPLRLAKL